MNSRNVVYKHKLITGERYSHEKDAQEDFIQIFKEREHLKPCEWNTGDPDMDLILVRLKDVVFNHLEIRIHETRVNQLVAFLADLKVHQKNFLKLFGLKFYGLKNFVINAAIF